MPTHHHHTVDFKTAFTIETLPASQVKISRELPYVEVASERTAALVALGRDIEIDGFRKGHIPEAILVKHLGEMRIMAEMAERAIAHAYPHILEEHNIDAIGHPQIEITKIAPSNPLGFTATVAVVPAITLPDYKSIAKTINASKAVTVITDNEVDEKIADIRKQKAAYERLQQKAAPADENLSSSETTDPADETLSPLTDEIAQSLGQPGQFSGMGDLKTKLKEHLTIEKERDAAAQHRAALTDAIITEVAVVLPQVLIDSELNQMFAQMQEDLERANLKFEDYLSHIKKTKEELRAEWTPAAEKRAKLQLVLNEIAKQETITPDPTELADQTNALLDRFKDADRHRVQLYVASVLTNEAVMKKIESYA